MKKGKGRRRLETLIRFMEKLPRSANKHFDMGTFFSHDGIDVHPDAGGTLSFKGMLDCGTSACALGWATVCPSLRKQGLSMEISSLGRCGFCINGRTAGSAFKAAERFFELGEFEAHDFFGTDAATPKTWARMARKRLSQMES